MGLRCGYGQSANAEGSIFMCMIKRNTSGDQKDLECSARSSGSQRIGQRAQNG